MPLNAVSNWPVRDESREEAQQGRNLPTREQIAYLQSGTVHQIPGTADDGHKSLNHHILGWEVGTGTEIWGRRTIYTVPYLT